MKVFPFLSLPAEMRFRIYELVLVKDHVIHLDPLNHWPKDSRGWWQFEENILLASKFIRDEALPVLFAHNCFGAPTNSSYDCIFDGTLYPVYSNIRRLTCPTDVLRGGLWQRWPDIFRCFPRLEELLLYIYSDTCFIECLLELISSETVRKKHNPLLISADCDL